VLVVLVCDAVLVWDSHADRPGHRDTPMHARSRRDNTTALLVRSQLPSACMPDYPAALPCITGLPGYLGLLAIQMAAAKERVKAERRERREQVLRARLEHQQQAREYSSTASTTSTANATNVASPPAAGAAAVAVRAR
jgi:hypothetical protein